MASITERPQKAGQPGATDPALMTTFVCFSVFPRASPGPQCVDLGASETGSHRAPCLNPWAIASFFQLTAKRGQFLSVPVSRKRRLRCSRSGGCYTFSGCIREVRIRALVLGSSKAWSGHLWLPHSDSREPAGLDQL